jgi:hypothetical protein
VTADVDGRRPESTSSLLGQVRGLLDGRALDRSLRQPKCLYRGWSSLATASGQAIVHPRRCDRTDGSGAAPRTAPRPAPWFTGGSSYSRIAPISSSHIESTPGYRDDSYVSFNWKRLLAGLALAAVGVLLLVVGL